MGTAGLTLCVAGGVRRQGPRDWIWSRVACCLETSPPSKSSQVTRKNGTPEASTERRFKIKFASFRWIIAMRNILAEEIEHATGRSARTSAGLGMPTSMLVPTARKLGIRNATIVFPLPIGALGARPSAKDDLYKVKRWWTPPPLDATWQRLRLVYLPNTERGHIQFDAWGNAPFSDEARLQSIRNRKHLHGKIDTTGLHTLLLDASQFAREQHCKIVFTAHDSRVSRQLNGETLEPIAALVVREFPELEWINLRFFHLADSLFKDNKHLVESGARMLTRELCARTDF